MVKTKKYKDKEKEIVLVTVKEIIVIRLLNIKKGTLYC